MRNVNKENQIIWIKINRTLVCYNIDFRHFLLEMVQYYTYECVKRDLQRDRGETRKTYPISQNFLSWNCNEWKYLVVVDFSFPTISETSSRFSFSRFSCPEFNCDMCVRHLNPPILREFLILDSILLFTPLFMLKNKWTRLRQLILTSFFWTT